MTETTRYTYDLIEPPEKHEHAFEFYMNVIIPMMDEFWKSVGEKRFGARTWALPPMDFVNLWKDRHFAIVMAYEGKQPVGFLWAMRLRPFLYQRQIMQVEPFYGRTPEIERGLLEYLFLHRKFMEVDDIVVPEYSGEAALDIESFAGKAKQFRTYKAY